MKINRGGHSRSPLRRSGATVGAIDAHSALLQAETRYDGLMTSSLFSLRPWIAGAALCCAVPVAAQDIRNIPEKIDTRVTGPAQTKPGREVQGPPAPLETQLRDTPPDEPIARQPSPQPPVQIRPRATTPEPAASERQAEAMPRGTSRPAQRTMVPATVAPDQRQAEPAVAAPAAGAAQTTAPVPMGGGVIPSASDVPATPVNAPTVGNSADLDIAADPEATNIAAKPGPNGMPWMIGGAAVALLVGFGYALTRRKRNALAGASDYGGIEFGQTPDAKALGPVPSPIARQPAEREAPPPQPRSAAASTPPPPPPPPLVKPSSDGRIVSRLRAGADEPPPPALGPRPVSPTPSAPPAPPPPVIPASDGRIVSRLKVSDLVEEEAAPSPPPPPPPARRRTGPAVRTVSVGYSVKGKDAE